MSSTEEFEEAAERIRSVTINDNEIKLQLYALFKQSTLGPCNTSKPGFWDFTAKAKWTAWNDLGNLDSDLAQSRYIELVHRLAPKGSELDLNEAKEASHPKSTFGPVVSVMKQPDESHLGDLSIFDHCQYGHVDEVKKILSSGHDANIMDDQGLTLLHWACDAGSADLTNYLVNKINDINVQDKEGQTPLHYAVVGNHVECVKILLDHGAKVDIPDLENETPQDLAEGEVKQLFNAEGES